MSNPLQETGVPAVAHPRVALHVMTRGVRILPQSKKSTKSQECSTVVLNKTLVQWFLRLLFTIYNHNES